MEVENLALPYQWEVSKGEVDEIRVWCLNKNNETTLLRIPNHINVCYVQLPTTYNGRRVDWNVAQAERLYNVIKRGLGRNAKSLVPFASEHCVMKKTLYDLKLDLSGGNVKEAIDKLISGQHKQFPMLMLGFTSVYAVYSLQNLLKKPIDRGDGLGQEMYFNVWEVEIDAIVKLLAYRKIHHCSWIRFSGIKQENYNKISTFPHEYIVDWRSITNEKTEEYITKPSLIGFDIEAYSDKHRVFPKGKVPEHDAICIGVIWARDDMKKDERHRFIIVQGDINAIPEDRFKGVHTIHVDNQKALVDWLGYLITSYKANAILTYNGLGFDYNYLQERLDINGYEWSSIGMIKGEQTEIKQGKKWESAAYGINKDVQVCGMSGILNFDLYKIVRRDFKLPEYKLGKVGLYFKLGTKDDITPEYMFKAYEQMQEALADLEDKFDVNNAPILASVAYRIYQYFSIGDSVALNSILRTVDQRIVTMLRDNNWIEKLTEAYNNAIAKGFNATAYEDAVQAMTDVAVYCIQDVELCFDLYEHFKLWVASIEIANIVGVNMIDLYSRGQQVRCISQLYRAAYKQGIVMDIKPVEMIPFVGGKVVNPEVGLHDNVLVLDFKSLYPLLICAYNICYTTYVPPALRSIIPEEMCNVIKVNCNEDFDPSADMMDLDEEEVEHVKQKGKQYCHGKKGYYEFWYIKKEYLPGLLPKLVSKLVDKRDEIVKVLKTMDKTTGRGLVLDKRQLGLKISANSFFGFLGVLKNGKRPFRQGAISITAWGRKSIEKVIDFLKTTYNAKIIYGDTDSCMIQLPDHIKKPEDCEYWMERLSKEITDLFPKPMMMKPEYAARMLALMKKKYLMIPMLQNKDFRYTNGILDENGQFKLDKSGKLLVETKGVLSARRDNCEWACEVYDDIAYDIMTRQPFNKVINYMLDRLTEAQQGKISYENFVITRSLRDNYKSKSYFMKVFSDVLISMGTPAQPGERLPYLVYVNPGAELIGHKMVLRDTYLADPEKYKIDYIYYIDKILTSPVDQIISAAYQKEIKYLKTVRFRRTKQCKYIGMEEPATLAVQIMLSESNKTLEDLRYEIMREMDKYNPEKDYDTQIFSTEELINMHEQSQQQQQAPWWNGDQQNWNSNQPGWGQTQGNQPDWNSNQQCWNGNQQCWDGNQQNWNGNQQGNQQCWNGNQQCWNGNQQGNQQNLNSNPQGNQQYWNGNQQNWGQVQDFTVPGWWSHQPIISQGYSI